MTPTPCDRLLRMRDVEARVGLHRATIYRKMKQEPPTFPAPKKLSSGIVRWPESAINAWVQNPQ